MFCIFLKRERSERKSGKLQGRLSGGGDDDDSEESDWEPEAEVMPPEREQTRSGRQRKRPSFFQVCTLREYPGFYKLFGNELQDNSIIVLRTCTKRQKIFYVIVMVIFTKGLV